MTAHLHTLVSLAAGHPVPAAAAALAALVLVWLAWRGVRNAVTSARRAAGGYRGSAEDTLTLAVAGLATAVAVTGMWRFFGVELHDGGAERALFCAVLELAAFTEAVRAKRNMAEHGSAGIDGAAMWALAGLSGLLAAWAAGSLAAAAFRLCMPLVAAWLWHRGLALARRRAGGRSIHWRITPERVLVRLGLADPTGRTSSEAAAQRRLTVLAQAAKRVRRLDAATVTGWRLARAERHLDAAMTGAVEFAGLAADPARQAALLGQLGALYRARGLAALDAPAPWDAPQEPAETPHGADGFADEAADLLADLAAELAAMRAARLALESARAEDTGPHGADRTEDADPDSGPAADRDAVVADLVADILTAAAAGESWHPDYPALMARTGRRKRWCEGVVAAARRMALGAVPAAGEPRTDDRMTARA